MKVTMIADSIGLGVMEARPEPAWRVRLQGMRNKDLLAPDYGSMHVASYLRASGRAVSVVNLIADVHDSVDLFEEPVTDPDGLSGSAIGGPDACAASRYHLFRSLEEDVPDVILFPLSIYNLALYTRRLLGEIRAACPGSTVITGGIYATLHPDEILEDGIADVVVRGEGEVTTARLLESLERGGGPEGIPGVSYVRGGRSVHNPPAAQVRDLDSFPHLYTVSEDFRVKRRHELLSSLNPYEDYIPGSGFLTSRGCPEACRFCLDPALNGRRTRFHSPGYVKEVLDYCSDRFTGGTGSFFFGDATFTMKRERLYRILDLVGGLGYTYQIQTRADYLDGDIIRRLAGSGFTAVAIGAESFNQRILREVAGKQVDVREIIDASLAVKKAGMNPALTFIAGLPGETRESIWRTVDTLVENGLLTATFFPLVVFRGTDLYKTFIDMTSPEEREALRLNPESEEFMFVGDEFSTREELTDFTREVNEAVMKARLSSG